MNQKHTVQQLKESLHQLQIKEASHRLDISNLKKTILEWQHKCAQQAAQINELKKISKRDNEYILRIDAYIQQLKQKIQSQAKIISGGKLYKPISTISQVDTSLNQLLSSQYSIDQVEEKIQPKLQLRQTVYEQFLNKLLDEEIDFKNEQQPPCFAKSQQQKRNTSLSQQSTFSFAHSERNNAKFYTQQSNQENKENILNQNFNY